MAETTSHTIVLDPDARTLVMSAEECWVTSVLCGGKKFVPGREIVVDGQKFITLEPADD